MDNAVYAITALRWQGPVVAEAMMGLLDTDRMQWDFAPSPARASTVIDRLLEGDTVVTCFPQDGEPCRLGPGVQVGLSPEGTETLALADERSDTCLQDLPSF